MGEVGFVYYKTDTPVFEYDDIRITFKKILNTIIKIDTYIFINSQQ